VPAVAVAADLLAGLVARRSPGAASRTIEDDA
jgi:hypothetical protein